MLPIEPAFRLFFDLSGKLLSSGFIYFGQPDLNPVTDPITVYWDAAGTIPALQPLEIINGTIVKNGSPANVFCATNYSELVQDKAHRQIYYEPDSNNFSTANIINSFITFIASSSGASGVGFIQSGSGATARTVQDELRDQVKLKQFLPEGFVTNGTVDYTADILEAISRAGVNGQLVWPSGTWLASQKLTIPAGQRWLVEGGKRSCTIKKNYNGDAVELGSQSAVFGMNIDAQGATFSGRGFYVASGNSQIIRDCRVSLSQAPSLEFATDAGGGAYISNFEGDTTNPTVVGAIKIGQQSGPVPKFFDGIWLSGGLLDIASPGAGNGCSMSNFYIRNILTVGPIVSGSTLMHFTNGRVASILDTTTISGADITFAGVAFSGAVALINAQGMRFPGCTFGSGITEDIATCQSNQFTINGTYPITWTQPSGAQPVLGNGTLTGWYSRLDSTCTVNVRLIIGSTTTFGNGATGYQFSLPFNSTTGFNQRGVLGNVFDLSALADFTVQATIPGGGNIFTLSRNGSGVRDGFPIAWAAGDTIDIQFEYMCK